MKTVKIGFVGCGAISGIYLENITKRFKEIEIIGVCDLIRERAENAVKQYNIPKLYNDMHELFADPEVDIVLNITRPYEHYEVSMAALRAGKHVYSEKPLGASLAEGREIKALAAEKGLMLGGAPDTFLGAGIQTCRKLIDDGVIGKVVGCAGFMICHGHETWHPDPEFYYKYGGGPMFDMGPYYLTALVSLIGSVDSVAGMTHTSFPTRRVTSQPNYGQIVEVEVPTHVNGLLRFHNGAVGNIITTFDVWGSTLPWIEIHGTRGSIQVPDPNGFGGQVMLKQYFDSEFKPYPTTFGYTVNSRGLGVWDMADCILTGRKDLRASGKLALHVLEIMEKIHVSSDNKAQVDMETAVERPTPMPM